MASDLNSKPGRRNNVAKIKRSRTITWAAEVFKSVPLLFPMNMVQASSLRTVLYIGAEPSISPVIAVQYAGLAVVKVPLILWNVVHTHFFKVSFQVKLPPVLLPEKFPTLKIIVQNFGGGPEWFRSGTN